MSAKELINLGIEENLAHEWIKFRSLLNPRQEEQKLQQANIHLISQDCPTYPPPLKHIAVPPPLIYVRGELKPCSFLLAIVGSRKISPYGKRVASQLSRQLAARQIGIVSGLALGVDAEVHRAVIEMGGYTIAVLGSGIDDASIYPRSNFQLAQRIIKQGGALISEFPPFAPPLKQHFPQRNRIIAGLTQGVIVVEAGEKSGALITAYYALEEGREVMAVPGNIYSPNSQGTNRLIQKGAHLISSAQDCLELFGLTSAPKCNNNKANAPLTEEEKNLLKHFDSEPISAEELAMLAKTPAPQINQILSWLELKGVIKDLGGKKFVKI